MITWGNYVEFRQIRFRQTLLVQIKSHFSNTSCFTDHKRFCLAKLNDLLSKMVAFIPSLKFLVRCSDLEGKGMLKMSAVLT